MAYNTVEEIKNLLLLATENQTLTDAQIQQYLDDANIEMVSMLKRALEIDTFIARESGSVTFYPFFNVQQVTSVRVRSTSGSWVELDESEYRLVRNNDGIEIDNLKFGDGIEVYSVPPNYKMLERAIAIVTIRTRLNPFKNETVDPIYAEWKTKQDNYLKVLRGKFGVARYSG